MPGISISDAQPEPRLKNTQNHTTIVIRMHNFSD